MISDSNLEVAGNAAEVIEQHMLDSDKLNCTRLRGPLRNALHMAWVDVNGIQRVN